MPFVALARVNSVQWRDNKCIPGSARWRRLPSNGGMELWKEMLAFICQEGKILGIQVIRNGEKSEKDRLWQEKLSRKGGKISGSLDTGGVIRRGTRERTTPGQRGRPGRGAAI